jgi:hypothetical protein
MEKDFCSLCRLFAQRTTRIAQRLANNYQLTTNNVLDTQLAN